MYWILTGRVEIGGLAADDHRKLIPGGERRQHTGKLIIPTTTAFAF